MPVNIGGREIRFGLWYDFRNPPEWRRDNTELYARTFEHIRYAERLGFDDIWTSEHHFIEDGYSPSLLPICAVIAAQTTRVRIGTNVLLLPLHDPVRVAEDAATVDVISGGRFDLGVALGYRIGEFEGMNIDRKSRRGRMEEAVEVIRRSWSDGPFTFEGKYYQYRDIDVTPKPAQQPAPLWLGGFVEPAVRRAARLGDGLLGAANVIDTFVEEWRAQGKGEPTRIALSLPWAAISYDPDKTWDEIGDHILYQRRLYASWFGGAGMNVAGQPPEDAASLRERQPNIVVTPAHAREFITSLVERLPVTNLYWWAIPPGRHPKAMDESVELFSREVLTPA